MQNNNKKGGRRQQAQENEQATKKGPHLTGIQTKEGKNKREIEEILVKIAEHVLATLVAHHAEATLQQHILLTRKVVAKIQAHALYDIGKNPVAIVKDAYQQLKAKHFAHIDSLSDNVRYRIKNYYKSLDYWNKENLDLTNQTNATQFPSEQTTSATFKFAFTQFTENTNPVDSPLREKSQPGPTKAIVEDSAFEQVKHAIINGQMDNSFADDQSSTNKNEDEQVDSISLASHDSPIALQEAKHFVDQAQSQNAQSMKVEAPKSSLRNADKHNSQNTRLTPKGTQTAQQETEFKCIGQACAREHLNEFLDDKTNGANNPFSVNAENDESRQIKADKFKIKANQEMIRGGFGWAYQLYYQAYLIHPTQETFELMLMAQTILISTSLYGGEDTLNDFVLHSIADGDLTVNEAVKKVIQNERLSEDKTDSSELPWRETSKNFVDEEFKRQMNLKSWEVVFPQIPSYADIYADCEESLNSYGQTQLPDTLKKCSLNMFTLLVFLFLCFFDLNQRIIPFATKLILLPPEVTLHVKTCIDDGGGYSYILQTVSFAILSLVFATMWSLFGRAVFLSIWPFIWVLVFGPFELSWEFCSLVLWCGRIALLQPRWMVNIPLTVALFIGKGWVGIFWSLPLFFLWGQVGYWIVINCSLYFVCLFQIRSSLVSTVFVLLVRALWAIFSWISIFILGFLFVLLFNYLSTKEGFAEEDDKQRQQDYMSDEQLLPFVIPLSTKPPKGTTGEIRRVLSCGDYYQVLELERAADECAIKKAKRLKSLSTHPDKLGDVVGAKEAFQRVTEAYEVLVDAAQRKLYDECLRLHEDKMNRSSRTSTQQNNCSNDQSLHEFVIQDSFGVDHIAIRVNLDARRGRYCDRCRDYHAAKNGEIWVFQEPGLIRGKRRVLVCCEGQVFDVTSWAEIEQIAVDYLGRQIPSNTHQAPIKFQSNKMKGRRKGSSQRSTSTSSQYDTSTQNHCQSQAKKNKKFSKKGRRK